MVNFYQKRTEDVTADKEQNDHVSNGVGKTDGPVHWIQNWQRQWNWQVMLKPVALRGFDSRYWDNWRRSVDRCGSGKSNVTIHDHEAEEKFVVENLKVFVVGNLKILNGRPRALSSTYKSTVRSHGSLQTTTSILLEDILVKVPHFFLGNSQHTTLVLLLNILVSVPFLSWNKPRTTILRSVLGDGDTIQTTPQRPHF